MDSDLLPLSCQCLLQPGDCVIINAANSVVGRTLLQLCKLLKLRAVAILRTRASSAAGSVDARFDATAEQLKALGATLVLKDEASIKVRLVVLCDLDQGCTCTTDINCLVSYCPECSRITHLP